MNKPLIIAHRGASGYTPENTITSFKEALKMGCDGVELDVHFTKDGHLVVCHDERVDRTTNGKGFIKDLSLKEIKELDAGSWLGEEFHSETIPTLDQVLRLFVGKNLLINIELKSGPIIYHGIEKEVIKKLEALNMVDNSIISSFNHYSLLEVKKISRRFKIGILYVSGLVDPWEYAKKLGAEAIHPFFYTIYPEIVKGCKENGILINTYTVNDESHMLSLAKAGVSGIITNYPDVAKRIIKAI